MSGVNCIVGNLGAPFHSMMIGEALASCLAGATAAI